MLGRVDRFYYDEHGDRGHSLEEVSLTTEAELVPMVFEVGPLRPRLAHIIMRAASRIGWAEPELRGLGAVVRAGDVVFDVGAAHGMYTVPLARLVGPEGVVQSFEPHPRQQGQLRFLRRLLGARHIRVNPGAVGAVQGEHTMRLPVKFGFPIYGHAHIADNAAALPPDVKLKHWTTPMHTIDDWCTLHGIDSVSFIKVDVEGFEPNVVAGATKTITSSLPSMLLEIEDRHLGRYGRDANQFADEIRSTWPQYRMYTYVDDTWTPTDHITVEARNYLFATDAAFARAS